MTKIIRNKLSIDGISQQEILNLFLSTWTENRTCLVIMPYGIEDYRDTINSVLGEGQEEITCKTCQQIVRGTSLPDTSLDDLVKDSALVTIHCESVEHATSIYDIFMEEQRKIGDIRYGSITYFEVWSNGKRVLPET